MKKGTKIKQVTKNKLIALRLTTELYNKLQLRSEKEDNTVSKIIERSIKAYLNKR